MNSTTISQNKHEAILSVQHIRKSYGEGRNRLEVLKDVNFNIKPGEWAAIMGPSGSGKTTLLNLIGLLDKEDEGHIFLEGTDILSLKSNEKAFLRSNKIGIVFQNHYLVPTMTVKENVELPFIWSREKINLAEMEERTQAAIEIVGLGDRSHHFPDEISGGEKQRTAIARALVNKNPLLLLDEPTGDLDSQTGKAILSIFRKIANQGDTSIIMVTHDPEAAQLADRVLLLRQGTISEL